MTEHLVKMTVPELSRRIGNNKRLTMVQERIVTNYLELLNDPERCRAKLEEEKVRLEETKQETLVMEFILNEKIALQRV